jgi:hypothetical protein
MTDFQVLPMWQRALRRWRCQHEQTIVTPRTTTMPAHTVCQSCGWREPVAATMPASTRTWDSSRDEERYTREKRRRAALETQRQVLVSRIGVPAARAALSARDGEDNVLDMRHARAR